jgi:hypothetical protein
MTVREWLRMQQPDFYCDEILKFETRLDKHINVLRDYAEK